MTNISLERIADTLYPKQQSTSNLNYGIVTALNSDGSLQVQMSASTNTTSCAKLCNAQLGDAVLVARLSNGQCAAIGRVGGSKWKLVAIVSGTATQSLSSLSARFDEVMVVVKCSKGQVSGICTTAILPMSEWYLGGAWAGDSQTRRCYVSLTDTSYTLGAFNADGSTDYASSCTTYIYGR